MSQEKKLCSINIVPNKKIVWNMPTAQTCILLDLSSFKPDTNHIQHDRVD